jgi:TonB family protein
MSPENIRLGIAGQVLIEIQFNEDGEFVRAAVIQSTNESLTRDVVAAVSQWRIEPPTSGGKRTGVRVRQTFRFQTEP